MKPIIGFALFALLVSGCTLTSPRFEGGTEADFEELTRIVRKRKIKLIMNDGAKHTAYRTRFTSDSTYYWLPGLKEERAVSTCDIAHTRIEANYGYWIGSASFGGGIALIAVGAVNDEGYDALGQVLGGMALGIFGLVLNLTIAIASKRPSRASHTLYKMPKCL